MIKYGDYFFISLILILPLTLITGPAVPDISITLTGIYFILFVSFKYDVLKLLKNNLVYLTIIFWIFLLLISIFSENKILAYRDSTIFIRILLIPIFLYYWIFNNEDNLKKGIKIIFFTILFVCLDTFYQFTNYTPELGFGEDIFGFKSKFYGRLSGPFQDLVPGAYISKFSFIGLLFIFLYLKNQKIISIAYLTFVGLIIYITGERMAFATFILGIFLLFFLMPNKKIIFFNSLCLVLFSLYIVNNLHPAYNDYTILESKPYHLGLKVEKNINCKNNISNKCTIIKNLQPSFLTILQNFPNSAYGEIYTLAYKMWKDHPITGIGMNNFTFLCKHDLRYKNVMKKINCVTHPHNYYLQWLVETGLFGLIIFILYLIIIFKETKIKINNPYTCVSFVTLIILFWPIMSTGSLLKNWNGVSTFYIIGICLALNRFKQKI